MNYENVFKKDYKQLNDAQRQAVDQIYDPQMVLAGPGTGKTQLLSMRIANILRKTDTNPSNILAMTFTDNGADNIRSRLSTMVGARTAGQVNIFTYHGFADKIRNDFADFLPREVGWRTIDELRENSLANEIYDTFPRNSMIKNGAPKHAQDIAKTVKKFKNQGLSPDDIRQISAQNERVAAQINHGLGEIETNLFWGRTAKDDIAQKLKAITELNELFDSIDEKRVHDKVPTLSEELTRDLAVAVNGYNTETTNFASFNAFRDVAFDKEVHKSNAKTIVAKRFSNGQLAEIAEFYERYDTRKNELGFYNFDDMILDTIEILKNNADIRETLRSKYEFILLDEYQDTNLTQARIVELLTLNDFHEAPNVMAVGDDDQGIMTFQGAEFGNIADFIKTFHVKKPIILSENYRSGPAILEFAKNIIADVDDEMRIDPNKPLNAAKVDGKLLNPRAEIARQLFDNSESEFAWVADEVQNLLRGGETGNNIAIIAPTHNILVATATYFSRKNIAIKYEKRENILDDEVMTNLLNALRLINILSDANQQPRHADFLWPKVLAADWWQADPSHIFQISEAIASTPHGQPRPSWTAKLLESNDETLHGVATFILRYAQLANEKTVWSLLAMMSGFAPDSENSAVGKIIRNPIARYFDNDDLAKYTFSTDVATLLAKLREYWPDKNNTEITLDDLLNLIDHYQEADLKITNRFLLQTGADPVVFLTAHAAKGLEFKRVFILSADNKSWNGSGGRQQINLPENLRFVDPSGHDRNERVRLFFVAITRAREFLTISSSATKPLEFLDENWDTMISHKIPEPFSKINDARTSVDDNPKSLADNVATGWRDFYLPEHISPRELLNTSIKNFAFTPTNLTTYYDLIYGGPIEFYNRFILHFPNETSAQAQFGSIFHDVFDRIEKFTQKNNTIPSQQEISSILDEAMTRASLNEDEAAKIRNDLMTILHKFMKSRAEIFNVKAESEIWIDHVQLGDATLEGKIDRVEFNDDGSLTLIDFKTGHVPKADAEHDWSKSKKLWKYEIQLYFYKFLAEAKWPNKVIKNARLEMVEGFGSDDDPAVINLVFTDKKVKYVTNLINNLRGRVDQLDFQHLYSNPTMTIKQISEFINEQLDNE